MLMTGARCRLRRFMKLLLSFLAGFATGIAVCWVYVGHLKATIRLYETYIHRRIDAMARHGQSNEKPPPGASRA
jgi:hypothetical protein